MTITYTGVPAVTTSVGSTTFTQGGGAVAVDPAVTVSDASSSTLASGTVAITSGLQSGEDRLGFTNQNGITGSYDVSTGVLDLSGSATLAEYQSALQSVTYNDTSATPNPTARTVSFTVNDGTNSSITATKTVDLVLSTTTVVQDATATFSTSSRSVTLAASVTPSSGTVNEGTVTFTLERGATTIGTPTPSATVSADSASVSYTIPGGTAAGTYAIDAVYNPGADFTTSSDATHSLDIAAASTSVAGQNATAGFSSATHSVTLSATVTSGAGPVNEGTVTFTLTQGSTTIGTATTSGTVTSGAANVSYALPANLAPGTYTINAAYNAGSDYTTSSDGSHSLVVGSVSSSTSLAVSTNAPLAKQPVTFTATVTGSGPTGQVTFLDGTTSLGTGTLSAGRASLTTSALEVGSHQISASYGGDSANTASTSSPAQVAVHPRQAGGAAVASTPDALGYWLSGPSGSVTTFGDATSFGSMAGKTLNQPVVGIDGTPDGAGYWLVASDGGVFAFGDAGYYGSMAGHHLNAPIVALAATPDGKGYWLVASDGGVFAFGDAVYDGSMVGRGLNQPVVGIAPTPDGLGYWLVASDGGVFAFGDAGFFGSLGNLVLNDPIVGLTVCADGHGYWLVGKDGGVFAEGGASFYGSTGGSPGSAPIVGLLVSRSGLGYNLISADGNSVSFGS